VVPNILLRHIDDALEVCKATQLRGVVLEHFTEPSLIWLWNYTLQLAEYSAQHRTELRKGHASISSLVDCAKGFLA
jgi:hypothetical protein